MKGEFWGKNCAARKQFIARLASNSSRGSQAIQPPTRRRHYITAPLVLPAISTQKGRTGLWTPFDGAQDRLLRVVGGQKPPEGPDAMGAAEYRE